MFGLIRVLALAVIVGGIGCASRSGPVVEPFMTTCAEPTLTAVQAPALQSQGDISITVAPIVPQCELRTMVSYVPTERPVSWRNLLVPGDTSASVPWYERRESQRLQAGDDLGFTVTIVNQSPRVFRGAGMVVSYQVDGAEIATDAENYASVVNAQILPGQQRQVEIRNLGYGDAADGATIGLYLYDVVTERDDAGTPTVRSNYEWFFAMSSEERSGPGFDATCTIPMTRIDGSPSERRVLSEDELELDPARCPSSS